MAVPRWLHAIAQLIKNFFRELKATAAPVDPLQDDSSNKMRRNSSHLNLFHPLAPATDRKTLVLDLDETLVHSTLEWVSELWSG